MSALPTTIAGDDPDEVATLVKGALGQDRTTPPAVVVLRGGAASAASFAADVAAALDRPLFRLAVEDLLRPPHDRAVALARLLDAAAVAGAITLVDAADAVVGTHEVRPVVGHAVAAATGQLVLLAEPAAGGVPADIPVHVVVDLKG